MNKKFKIPSSPDVIKRILNILKKGKFHFYIIDVEKLSEDTETIHLEFFGKEDDDELDEQEMFRQVFMLGLQAGYKPELAKYEPQQHMSSASQAKIIDLLKEEIGFLRSVVQNYTS